MRVRLRDWPMAVYKYHVEIIGELPQEAWDTAKAMQKLWNDLAQLHEDTRKKVSEEGIAAKQKREVWTSFKESSKQLVKSAPLDWVAGPEVMERFETTCRMAKQRPGKDERPGWPKIQWRLERIAIPYRFTSGGLPVAKLFTSRNNRVALRTLRGFSRGRFVVGEKAIDFNVVLHRPLPPEGIVKKVTWLGRHDVFGWHWSLAITVEAPPQVAKASTGRIAGLDVGWRKINNYIRIAMLADSDGNAVEFRLPLIASTSKTRRLNEHLYAQGKSLEDTVPESYFELLNLDERIGLLVEGVKSKLRESLPKDLSGDIRASVNGLTKMRQGGLVRLLRMLERAGIAEASQQEISAWLTENDKLRRRREALQQRLVKRREWMYGNIAAWIARHYDTLVGEGDLKIKPMIEEANKGRALNLADRYHQWAATSNLRLRIQKAADKFGMHIVDGQTAYSSSTCSVCGRSIKIAASLLLTCPVGHVMDRDVNGGVNLLRQMVDRDDMMQEAIIDLPEQLQGVAVIYETVSSRRAAIQEVLQGDDLSGKIAASNYCGS